MCSALLQKSHSFQTTNASRRAFIALRRLAKAASVSAVAACQRAFGAQPRRHQSLRIPERPTPSSSKLSGRSGEIMTLVILKLDSNLFVCIMMGLTVKFGFIHHTHGSLCSQLVLSYCTLFANVRHRLLQNTHTHTHTHTHMILKFCIRNN